MNFFSSQSLLSSKVPMDTRNAVLKTRSEVCQQKPKIFQSKCANEIIFFRKSYLSLNCFFGHVEFKVEKLAKVFRWMSENDGKKYALQRFFSSKRSYGHVGCSFDNPTKKASTKSQKNFAEFPKSFRKILFCQTEIFFPK